MNCDVRRVTDPTSPLIDGICAVEHAVALEQLGHADFADTPQSWRVYAAGSAYTEITAWAALVNDAVVGYAVAELPLQDNTQQVVFNVQVRADARRRGIGTALLEAVEAHARDRGRTVLQTYNVAGSAEPGAPHAITPVSGAGVLDTRMPGVAWLLHRGYVPEQAERISTLTIPDDRAAFRGQLAALDRGARARASGYEILRWRSTPEEYLDDVGRLISEFSVGMPLAGLDMEEERWDADRVRTFEARIAQRGQEIVATAARHAASGRIVGLTQLHWPAERPAGVWQETTYVMREHRGRRLGLALKADNVAHLLDVSPDAARIHTWNAEENEHMLAINEPLGFVTVGFEGSWQKRL